MQERREKISVIVPCHNVEHYIDRCLKSIEGQTYGMDHLEIILVDDTSIDSTYRHLSNFEKKYPGKVTLVACDESNGLRTARNIGLRYAGRISLL